MIESTILREIEDMCLESGQPVLAIEGTPEDFRTSDKSKLPEVFIRLIFETGKDEEIFRILNSNRNAILSRLSNRSFFVKPITFHYYLTSILLKTVCPDYKEYYLSPMTGTKQVVGTGRDRRLDNELKLILITKGNVPDESLVFERLTDVVRTFNINSRFIKVSKLEVASKNDPFMLQGEPEPTYREIAL